MRPDDLSTGILLFRACYVKMHKFLGNLSRGRSFVSRCINDLNS
jgi:hypothetical protein